MGALLDLVDSQTRKPAEIEKKCHCDETILWQRDVRDGWTDQKSLPGWSQTIKTVHKKNSISWSGLQRRLHWTSRIRKSSTSTRNDSSRRLGLYFAFRRFLIVWRSIQAFLGDPSDKTDQQNTGEHRVTIRQTQNHSKWASASKSVSSAPMPIIGIW